MLKLSNLQVLQKVCRNVRCLSFFHQLSRLHDIAPKQHTKCNVPQVNLQLESDDESPETEFKDERDSKIVRYRVNSLRADVLLKAGLGMSRNKVEMVFYENRIRVNGGKLAKKSLQLSIGDEIDVIRGFSSQNPSLLTVSRVEILEAIGKEENIAVQLRRYKALLIENYKGTNAYKSSQSQNE